MVVDEVCSPVDEEDELLPEFDDELLPELPEFELPELELPEFELPEFELPELELPEFEEESLDDEDEDDESLDEDDESLDEEDESLDEDDESLDDEEESLDEEDESLDEDDESLDDEEESLDEDDESLDEEDESLDVADESLDEEDESVDVADESVDEDEESVADEDDESPDDVDESPDVVVVVEALPLIWPRIALPPSSSPSDWMPRPASWVWLVSVPNPPTACAAPAAVRDAPAMITALAATRTRRTRVLLVIWLLPPVAHLVMGQRSGPRGKGDGITGPAPVHTRPRKAHASTPPFRVSDEASRSLRVRCPKDH
ncbi:hypothetical protein [Streptomyces sp. NPDC012756]|uniref:hypothetical protein n=1 Tax=Streptomyces sp. NPDC012756 TaxID=3364847 RepID=UPI003690F72E